LPQTAVWSLFRFDGIEAGLQFLDLTRFPGANRLPLRSKTLWSIEFPLVSAMFAPKAGNRADRGRPLSAEEFPANKRPGLLQERFQAKWKPVRIKKTRQNNNLEPRFDAIETEKALGSCV
jgi:hypothetical protein